MTWRRRTGGGSGGGSGGGGPVDPPVIPPVTGVPTMAPGALWTGVASSGFNSAPPVDPARVKAKPTLRLVTAPWQTFDGDFIVPFFSDCNGGVQQVVVSVEGNSVGIAAPVEIPYLKPDNTVGHWIAYAVKLDYAACMAVAIDGAVEVYATAIPVRGDFQSRVIGPYRFYPRAPGVGAGKRWAAEYTVGAAGQYQTIAAALQAVRQHPVSEAVSITLLDDGDYPLSGQSPSLPRRNWVRLQVASGKAARLTRAVPGGFYGARPYIDGLEFYGPNLTYDTRELLMSVESDWVAGVRHNGNVVTLEGGVTTRGNQRRATGLGSGGKPLYLENMRTDGIQGPIARPTLASNSVFSTFSADAFQNAECTHNIVIERLDYGTLREPQSQPAMTLAYNGSGVATLLVSGKTNSSTRTATLTVDDVVLGTYKFLRGTGETNHTSMGQFVAWLNGFSDFVAVLLDDRARAAEICDPTETSPLGTFSLVTLNATAQTFGWAVDAHVDGLQAYEDYHDGQIQNAFVTFRQISDGQLYFVGGQAPDITATCIETESNSPQPCQISQNSLNPGAHHFIRNCSFAGSTFAIRTDLVPYPDTVNNAIRNCVFRKFDWVGAATPYFVIDTIHAFDTASDSGLVINGTEGGDRAVEIPGYASAVFTPKVGGLLMNADGTYKGSRKPDGTWNV